MTLRPWLEIAQPRPDIADGSFDESLFAADLGMVAEGHGPADYVHPMAFAEKTYLTANLPPLVSTACKPSSVVARPTPCLPHITSFARRKQ
jgi:hypothetical protein